VGDAGVALVVLAAILFAVWWVARSRTRVAKRALEQGSRDDVLPDVTRPSPRVVDFHVRGLEALVTFAVPLPQGEVDAVLKDLLVQEALEVVREKRHHLPISDVHRVVALAGVGEEPRRVGGVTLEEPGLLPPPAPATSLISFSHIGYDPLEERFEEDMVHPPGLLAELPRDELRPLREELRIPAAVEIGLRTMGIDPETMTAGQMVTTVLMLFDYRVSPAGDGTFVAEKGGTKTYIRVVPHGPGDYPVLETEDIQRFVVEAQTSGATRAILVTDKYGPFEVYERENRDPKVRFITRERLQKFVDSMALG